MDDRDPEGITAFWKKIECWFRTYTKFSAVRLFGFTNREGVYLTIATVVLCILVALGSSLYVSDYCAYLVALPAVYYAIDSVLANTTITFITREPILILRSVLLTFLNVLNVGLAYAVMYAAQRAAFEKPHGAIEFIYFSFATLTTLGYGDIKPDGPGAWTGQLTVVSELITGLYLLAVVLTAVVSWAKRES
jgi:hypothetical protein